MGSAPKTYILKRISAFSAIWPSTKGGGRMAENTQILSKILNLVRSPCIAEPIGTFRIMKNQETAVVQQMVRTASLLNSLIASQLNSLLTTCLLPTYQLIPTSHLMKLHRLINESVINC